MRQFCLCAIFLSSCILAVAQKNGVVKGVAFDTLSKQPVASATITLMQRKDSSLVSFTMSDNSGRFEFTGIQNGEYRLLITHVNYHNSAQVFKMDDEHKIIDLGNIFMNDRSKVLSEVVVTSEAPPVTLVGDTIQYNAGSFKTQPNANVEDLLKKLPGVKVEKDGTVKAQGEKVQKVLVDGKEFFGNDPKVATKNLPADAVDKVQVYDKLSDQAQLTGFDDGNSEKTINLKLKKDKKKGMFGKVNAGAGTDGRYAGKMNANSFKGARQMSVIGMGNNINEEGFSFMDVLNFTGALNQLKNGGGNININISPDDPLAGLLGGNNTGINTTFGGGMNYNNIIGTKTDFQSNYLYTRYNPNRISHIQRQYFSPANVYNQNSYVDNLNNNHRLNFNVDYQIDSFHSIKITPALNYQKTRNKSLSDYMTWSEQGAIINDGNSYNLENNEGYNLNTNILFRKKFHKKRRTLSLNMLTNLNDNQGDGNLKSITDFFDQVTGLMLAKDSINQNNNTTSDLKGYNARVVYTEPIFKKSILEFSLGNSFTKSTSSKTTYDFNANSGKFDMINNALTNDYENTYGYTTGGLRLRKQTRAYNYALGLSWQQSELEGMVTQSKDSIITKTFRNFLPMARFQYYFSRFKNILINYNTNTNQPTISQLQPVPDNTNPLYIKVGNPRLKEEFIQTLRLNSSLVNPYKNRNLFVYLLLQQTQNKIVNYDKINSLGVDSVMPVNVNGVYNLNGNVSWGFPVRFLKGSLDISSTLSYYKGKQPVSDVNHIEMNQIKTATVGPQIRLNMSPTEKLDISLSAGVSYSNSKYSIQLTKNSKYFNQEYLTDIGWQLPRGFFFASDFVYTITNQYSTAFNTKVPLWNASIAKQMLRYKRGELKFSAHDLLGKNTHTSRSTNQNYIEDTRVNSLRRLFMLSFTYSLSKTGLNDAGSGGPKRIMR
jgi:hypothetical protein